MSWWQYQNQQAARSREAAQFQAQMQAQTARWQASQQLALQKKDSGGLLGWASDKAGDVIGGLGDIVTDSVTKGMEGLQWYDDNVVKNVWNNGTGRYIAQITGQEFDDNWRYENLDGWAKFGAGIVGDPLTYLPGAAVATKGLKVATMAGNAQRGANSIRLARGLDTVVSGANTLSNLPFELAMKGAKYGIGKPVGLGAKGLASAIGQTDLGAEFFRAVSRPTAAFEATRNQMLTRGFLGNTLRTANPDMDPTLMSVGTLRSTLNDTITKVKTYNFDKKRLEAAGLDASQLTAPTDIEQRTYRLVTGGSPTTNRIYEQFRRIASPTAKNTIRKGSPDILTTFDNIVGRNLDEELTDTEAIIQLANAAGADDLATRLIAGSPNDMLNDPTYKGLTEWLASRKAAPSDMLNDLEKQVHQMMKAPEYAKLSPAQVGIEYIAKRNYDNTMREINEGTQLTRQFMGNIGEWANWGDTYYRKYWTNGIDKYLVKPFTTMVLGFPFFPVGNVMEEASMSLIGGKRVTSPWIVGADEMLNFWQALPPEFQLPQTLLEGLTPETALDNLFVLRGSEGIKLPDRGLKGLVTGGLVMRQSNKITANLRRAYFTDAFDRNVSRLLDDVLPTDKKLWEGLTPEQVKSVKFHARMAAATGDVSYLNRARMTFEGPEALRKRLNSMLGDTNLDEETRQFLDNNAGIILSGEQKTADGVLAQGFEMRMTNLIQSHEVTSENAVEFMEEMVAKLGDSEDLDQLIGAIVSYDDMMRGVDDLFKASAHFGSKTGAKSGRVAEHEFNRAQHLKHEALQRRGVEAGHKATKEALEKLERHGLITPEGKTAIIKYRAATDKKYSLYRKRAQENLALDKKFDMGSKQWYAARIELNERYSRELEPVLAELDSYRYEFSKWVPAGNAAPAATVTPPPSNGSVPVPEAAEGPITPTAAALKPASEGVPPAAPTATPTGGAPMPQHPPVLSFRGTYLSNFQNARVTLDGEVYPSVEHAYQAAKTANPAQRERIRKAATAAEAKRLGRSVTLRPEFEAEKLGIMEDLVRQKFQDPALRKKLLETGDAELIEGNTWGDRFWGVSNGKGENHLGEIIKKVRGELRVSETPITPITRKPSAPSTDPAEQALRGYGDSRSLSRLAEGAEKENWAATKLRDAEAAFDKELGAAAQANSQVLVVLDFDKDFPRESLDYIRHWVKGRRSSLGSLKNVKFAVKPGSEWSGPMKAYLEKAGLYATDPSGHRIKFSFNKELNETIQQASRLSAVDRKGSALALRAEAGKGAIREDTQSALRAAGDIKANAPNEGLGVTGRAASREDLARFAEPRNSDVLAQQVFPDDALELPRAAERPGYAGSGTAGDYFSESDIEDYARRVGEDIEEELSKMTPDEVNEKLDDLYRKFVETYDEPTVRFDPNLPKGMRLQDDTKRVVTSEEDREIRLRVLREKLRDPYFRTQVRRGEGSLVDDPDFANELAGGFRSSRTKTGIEQSRTRRELLTPNEAPSAAMGPDTERIPMYESTNEFRAANRQEYIQNTEEAAYMGRRNREVAERYERRYGQPVPEPEEEFIPPVAPEKSRLPATPDSLEFAQQVKHLTEARSRLFKKKASELAEVSALAKTPDERAQLRDYVISKYDGHIKAIQDEIGRLRKAGVAKSVPEAAVDTPVGPQQMEILQEIVKTEDHLKAIDIAHEQSIPLPKAVEMVKEMNATDDLLDTPEMRENVKRWSTLFKHSRIEDIPMAKLGPIYEQAEKEWYTMARAIEHSRGIPVIDPQTGGRIDELFRTTGENIQKRGVDDLKAKGKEAWDEATREYHRWFTNYDSGSSVHQLMRHIFPFWRYELQRYPRIAKTALKHPFLATSYHRFMTQSEDGNVRIPGTSLRFNPTGGMMFNSVRTLMQNGGYAFNKNGNNWEQFNSLMQRTGFIPGPQVSIPLAAKGGAIGDAMPTTPELALNAASGYGSQLPGGIGEPIAQTAEGIQNLLPSRWRRYNTDIELIDEGIHPFKATPEQDLAARRAAARSGVIGEGSGQMFDSASEAAVEMRKERVAAAVSAGVPEDQAEEAARFRRNPLFEVSKSGVPYLNVAERRALTDAHPEWEQLAAANSSFTGPAERARAGEKFKDYDQREAFNKQIEDQLLPAYQAFQRGDIDGATFRELRDDAMTQMRAVREFLNQRHPMNETGEARPEAREDTLAGMYYAIQPDTKPDGTLDFSSVEAKRSALLRMYEATPDEINYITEQYPRQRWTQPLMNAVEQEYKGAQDVMSQYQSLPQFPGLSDSQEQQALKGLELLDRIKAQRPELTTTQALAVLARTNPGVAQITRKALTIRNSSRRKGAAPTPRRQFWDSNPVLSKYYGS